MLPRVRRRLVLCAAVFPALVGAGCAAAPAAPEEPPAPPAPACPVVAEATDGPARSWTVVDFVDFIRWNGHEYLSGSSDTGITEDDLGPVVGTSRCSFSEWNSRTGQMPPAATDGDTGFLPAGTPFHAVAGWRPECRLAAAHSGRLHVYLAQEPNAQYATPSTCALAR